MKHMLCTPGPLPQGDDWAYEVKWDGIRSFAICEAGTVRFVTRRGIDVTDSFPDLQCIEGTMVLDGELVAMDQNGKPSRLLLQHRSPKRGMGIDVRFIAFDLLKLNDLSLTTLPYDRRREALEALTLAHPVARTPMSLDGEKLWKVTAEQGLEGVVAKRRSSPYVAGKRSHHWIKSRHEDSSFYPI